jgi:hypothetical protein
MKTLIYNSSLTPVAPDAASRGQHKAGEVALNLYSHFSGSEIDSSALVVPQDNSTVADRIGPFQHFALLFSFSSSLWRVMGFLTHWCTAVWCSDRMTLLEQSRSIRRMHYMSASMKQRDKNLP